MLKTLGIVQASCADEECRSKITRKLNGKTILEWVVRRVTDSICLDGVIVLVDDSPENRVIRQQVPLDVPVFVGHQKDSLSRFVAALDEYPAESVVRVRAENPLVDPSLIDRLVTAGCVQSDCDYATYLLRGGRPAIFSPVGLYAEWFRAAALRKAAKEASMPADRTDVTQYLYSHPEKFKIRLVPAPSRIDREDLRLTVDQEEDLDHLLAIVDALGSEELDWQRIADLLDHQPNLRRRMAALNRESGRD
jgi:spore coat polysaccharide biosynthesis protein SpsF